MALGGWTSGCSWTVEMLSVRLTYVVCVYYPLVARWSSELRPRTVRESPRAPGRYPRACATPEHPLSRSLWSEPGGGGIVIQGVLRRILTKFISIKKPSIESLGLLIFLSFFFLCLQRTRDIFSPLAFMAEVIIQRLVWSRFGDIYLNDVKSLKRKIMKNQRCQRISIFFFIDRSNIRLQSLCWITSISMDRRYDVIPIESFDVTRE